MTELIINEMNLYTYKLKIFITYITISERLTEHDANLLAQW